MYEFYGKNVQKRVACRRPLVDYKVLQLTSSLKTSLETLKGGGGGTVNPAYQNQWVKNHHPKIWAITHTPHPMQQLL